MGREKRISLIVVLLVVLTAPSCEDFLHGCSDNLLTLTTPEPIESFRMQDKNGVVLWEVRSNAPRRLREIRYGEIPKGYVQIVPQNGERPRKFTPREYLTKVTTTDVRVFVHEGVASGVSGFCGGYYESSPRPGHEPPK